MPAPAPKAEAPKAPTAARATTPQGPHAGPGTVVDKRPQAVAQRQMQDRINQSPRVQAAAALQARIAHSPRQQQAAQRPAATPAPVQRKANQTGLPDELKSGVENLSGYAMDDVKVHYNSAKPAELQAHAYAQGTDIHVAPGQEEHLPHEAWHVVQQKQGRVRPTMQLKGKVAVNDEAGLEKEADVMGERALQRVIDGGQLTGVGQPQHVGVLQRSADVFADKRDDGSVVITSEGVVSDFQGGDGAKNKGWNGVKKYKADAKVGKNKTLKLAMVSNAYKAAQAGHILAEQNGGLGSDPDNVFAQDGGVNNGPFRKRFENPMRKQLNKAELTDKVKFRVVLYGDDITQGSLSKDGGIEGSDEESEFSDFEPSGSDTD